MKVKLLRKVRNDAIECWHSINSITRDWGRITRISCPSCNDDVIGYYCGEMMMFSDMLLRESAYPNENGGKTKFIKHLFHRYWNKRKDRYYKRYRKGGDKK